MEISSSWNFFHMTISHLGIADILRISLSTLPSGCQGSTLKWRRRLTTYGDDIMLNVSLFWTPWIRRGNVSKTSSQTPSLVKSVFLSFSPQTQPSKIVICWENLVLLCPCCFDPPYICLRCQTSIGRYSGYNNAILLQTPRTCWRPLFSEPKSGWKEVRMVLLQPRLLWSTSAESATGLIN